MMPRGDRLSCGIFLLLVGAVFLVGSRDIRRTGATAEHDPGSRMFPVGLALILTAGGAAAVASGLLLKPGPAKLAAAEPALTSPPSASDSLTDNDGRPSARRRLLPWLLIAGLLACTAAMPTIGFSAGAFLLAAAMMIALRVPWLQAVACSALLVAVVRLLFVQLFQKLLPTGWLGW
jgi:hypothetical protein